MDQRLLNGIIFAVGGALGSLITWRAVKGHYKRISDEEIESVRKFYQNEKEKLEKEESAPTPTAAQEVTRVASSYQTVPVSMKNSLTDEDIDKMVNRPYLIDPDDFGDQGDYELLQFTYYADGILADVADNIVEYPDELVGTENIEMFNNDEIFAIYVRNDTKMCDYEITRETQTYSQVTGFGMD